MSCAAMRQGHSGRFQDLRTGFRNGRQFCSIWIARSSPPLHHCMQALKFEATRAGRRPRHAQTRGAPPSGWLGEWGVPSAIGPTVRLFIGLGNYGVGVAGRREEIVGASWWYLGRPWKFGITEL